MLFFKKKKIPGATYHYLHSGSHKNVSNCGIQPSLHAFPNYYDTTQPSYVIQLQSTVAIDVIFKMEYTFFPIIFHNFYDTPPFLPGNK